MDPKQGNKATLELAYFYSEPLMRKVDAYEESQSGLKPIYSYLDFKNEYIGLKQALKLCDKEIKIASNAINYESFRQILT